MTIRSGERSLMPSCTKCKAEGPTEFFMTADPNTCLACHRERVRNRYYSFTQEKIAQKRARRKRRLDLIKTSKGCVDCGYNDDPVALQFDHIDRNDKTGTVSQMILHNLKKLFAEIKKCEIRCANCHMIKTHAGRDCHISVRGLSVGARRKEREMEANVRG